MSQNDTGEARSTTDSTPVALVTKPGDSPIACTLEPGAIPDRLADWRTLLAGVRARTATPDGAVRIELEDNVDLDEVTRLVVAEQRCCAFLSFSITVDARGIGLEVRAPDGAADVVASLFEAPS